MAIHSSAPSVAHGADCSRSSPFGDADGVEEGDQFAARLLDADVSGDRPAHRRQADESGVVAQRTGVHAGRPVLDDDRLDELGVD